MPRFHWLSFVMLLFALALCAPAWSQQAPANQQPPDWWSRAKSDVVGAYWIKTDLPPDQARRWARHLNAMFQTYQQRMASLAPRTPEKLNVLIFRRQAEYLSVLRQRYGIDAQGTSGLFFVTNSGTALALWTNGVSDRRIEHVLQHEGFHQFAASRFERDLPMWVNEGLAEYFGRAIPSGNKLLTGLVPAGPLGAVQEAIEQDKTIAFKTIMDLDWKQWNEIVRNTDAALHYHQAWSMVHCLIHADNGRYRASFERFLSLINAGVLADDAFAQVFGKGAAALAGFEKTWRAYTQNETPDQFATALDHIEFLAEGTAFLAAKDIYPESLDELKAALQQESFSFTPLEHGGTVFKAEDDRLFQIPGTVDSRGNRPMFVVEPFRPRPAKRRLEETKKTPPTIRTDHLKPRSIEVVWTREPSGTSFTWRLRIQ